MTPNDVAKHLRDGRLAALPTETVYGLAADAGNDEAVRRVFALKGRPSTNPLIVHVADAEAARQVTTAWPDTASRLAARFWPGPLTIVLPKAAGLAEVVTAGGDTVGVRVPNHPLTLQVLHRFHQIGGTGLAMPSANVSEHVSPTSADHVHEEFGDVVPVLDGGTCDVGIESTVVLLTAEGVEVLRPGHISLSDLRACVGRVTVRGGSDVGVAASPGRQVRHYAPRVPARLINPQEREVALQAEGTAVLVLDRTSPIPHRPGVFVMPDRPATYAQMLYDVLRRAEGFEQVLIERPPETQEWAAVHDRLRRATSA